ncbi:MAG: tripartite tricarboxylate transporter TctB family protein [Piscinibacter sp.]|nr:tripartite tricarboxylate transporter TctB family protein [Piscinibacter sp.]
MSQEDGDDERGLGQRWPEVGVTLFLLLVGALVVADSLRVGTGWADDGPRSGYFPFYIGLLLIASASWVLLRQIWRWKGANPQFATRTQMVSVIAVFLPMVVYVALVAGLGIYVASALLIGYFMRRYGAYRWLATAAVSVGVPLVVWAVFERWFLVLLPKGPLERALGL